MSAGRRYFQSPLNIFLSFYITKIYLEITLCIRKFFARIDYSWLNRIFINKKINYLIDMTNSIHVQAVHHSSFAGIFFWKNQSLKIFFSSLYRNGQRAL